jgi:PAS domain S-box-containing protein
MGLIMTQRPHHHNGHLDAIVAACPDAIISLGTDFVVKTWNGCLGLTKLKHGHMLSELIVPAVYKNENAGICAAVRNGETVLREMLRRHKDGHLVPVEINASPILDLAGRVIGASIIYRNISDRRRGDARRRPTNSSMTVRSERDEGWVALTNAIVGAAGAD